MPTFDEQNETITSNGVAYDFADKKSKGLFLSKVFGMMFICLLITTVIAAGFGYGFQALLNYTAVDGVYNQDMILFLMIVLGVSAVGLIVMSFVLPIVFIRGRHNIIVPLMIYVSLMGILLSSFTFLFEPIILVESFGITAIIFGTMGLIGYLSKGKMTGIGFILLGLLIGAGLISLINWSMILIKGISETNIMLSWIVSLAIFAFLMLITMYDVYRIRRIAESGASQGNNLIYYCAFILYSDFIALLIRVIYFLALIVGRRK